MSYLIAAVGLSGAGKTTALQRLAGLCGGKYVYLGQTVLDLVRARELPSNRESERIVRLALREKHGLGALVTLNADNIAGCLASGHPVLLDAIFNMEEFEAVRSLVPPGAVYLVNITAPFDIRRERLALRPDRSFTESELRARDKTELEILGIGKVQAVASHILINDHSVEVFHQNLSDFLATIRTRDGN